MLQHSVAGGNNLELYVQESGNPAGVPLLFIHGWNQASACWMRQMGSSLEKDFRLVFMDLRGHGFSQKPPEIEAYLDSQLWADDVAAVIRQLKLEKPVLVGWSYGGAVIADYVNHYGQDNLAGIVLCAATIHVGTPRAISYLNPEALAIAGGMFNPDYTQNVAATTAFVTRCTYETPPPNDFYTMVGYNLLVPIHVRQALLGRQLDSVESIGSVKLPALVVQGAEDGAVSTEASAELQKLLPHSQVVYYPETGHTPFYEQADRFNTDLTAFVRAVTS